MRTADAATPREGIFYIFLVFLLVYIALAAGLALLLLREHARSLEEGAQPQEAPDVA